ncbi:MAG: hypothetical protein JSS02_29180, partial [Planctomycetes bacterium]|nr:hypothetical protein [Planctomycetota bacterium]
MSERKCQSSLVWPALLAGLILLPALDAKAEVESPIQSMVRPLGLATSGRVHAAASDQKSAEFQKNALPKILDVIRTNLPEQKAIPDSFFKYGTPVPGRDALSL